jgi:protein-arginine kinase activator protein McsA
VLADLEEEMASQRPPTVRERLESQLQKAIEREEVETGAALRDRIRTLVDR